jgi:hypothetical protein
MTSQHTIGNEGLADAQTNDQDETSDDPDLRPTVELETQAKVDINHPDARPEGMTLEAEERMQAREAELRRMNERADARQDSDREARTRQAVTEMRRERRREFARRAASVDPAQDPDTASPLARLGRQARHRVEQEARRLATELEGVGRAALARQLARRVARGTPLRTASLQVLETARTAPGTVVPIGELEAVDREEVSIAGRVATLWEPAHPSQQQVGLIEDDTGRVKLTVWKKSAAPWLTEGERVRVHKASRSWYDGRVSLAVTGWTTIHFPERDAWWDR